MPAMDTPTTRSYNNGDRVDIVHGKYKGKKAMYLHKYGKVMCSVSIDGVHRNIWLSSIEPHEDDDQPKKKKKMSVEDHEKRTEASTRRKEEVKKLQKSIEDMKQQLDLMQSTLNSLLLDD